LRQTLPQFLYHWKYNQFMQSDPLPVDQTTRSAPRPSLSVKSYLAASFVLMLLGWSGLAFTVMMTAPSGGSRWMVFFTATLALTGTFLPIAAFLNRRFPSIPPPTHGVILRQALFAGAYLPTLAWLRLGLVLTPSLAVLIAFGFILVEWLLRMRERSRWSPES
jgi:hypothetical protein